MQYGRGSRYEKLTHSAIDRLSARAQAHATIIGLSGHVDQQASISMDDETFSSSYSGAVYQVNPRSSVYIYQLEEPPAGPDDEDHFMGFTTDPTADHIVGEYSSDVYAGSHSYVRDQAVNSGYEFSMSSHRFYDGSTPEGEYFYFNYILDTKVDFSFVFKVDGNAKGLRVVDYFHNGDTGIATYSLYDHTSGVTHYDPLTEFGSAEARRYMSVCGLPTHR